MKILLVNAIASGGAYAALQKFHEELSINGHTCTIMTPWSNYRRQYFRIHILRIFLRILYKFILIRRTKSVVSTQIIPTGLGAKIDECHADLAILFWVSDSISLSEISELKTPFLWRQSDNNLILPFEHYPENKVKCRIANLEKWILQKKKDFIYRNKMKVFGPSAKTVDSINYFVNNSAFTLRTPINKIYSNLPLTFRLNNKKILHFGFVSYKEQDLDRKNWKDVERFVEIVGRYRQCIIKHMGGSTLASLAVKVENCGFITREDDKILEFYDKIDALLFFSRQDNAPQVVLEAMARGCPVICYNVKGIADVIEDNMKKYIIDRVDEDVVLNVINNLSFENFAVRNQRIREISEKNFFNVDDLLRKIR